MGKLNDNCIIGVVDVLVALFVGIDIDTESILGVPLLPPSPLHEAKIKIVSENNMPK
jgi:hypothetical protein